MVQAMKPRYWFAGHLHVAFAAAVPHGPAGVLRPGDAGAERVTRFMAVDKPLPRRTFVQVRAITPCARGHRCLDNRVRAAAWA